MTMMPDHKTFRNYVKIVADKLEKGEYIDYDHSCGGSCVVGKALAEAGCVETNAYNSNSHLFVQSIGSEHLSRLFANTTSPRDQKEGAIKARTYLRETADLETV